LKRKLKSRNSAKYEHISCHDADINLYRLAILELIKTDQRRHFPELVTFFASPSERAKDVPALVTKVNLFTHEGVIKVKSKFDRWINDENFCFPILLAKNSTLTELVIRNAHERLAHGGVYNILSHLRKQFWVIHFFSAVKSVLKKCIQCRRFNARPIKLNQSSYRQFRAAPPSEPFKVIYVDYLGPFSIKLDDRRRKVWLLCVTCVWTRAVNLKICYDLSVTSFLRSFQVHVYEHGLPSLVFSDLGSQLTAGANLMQEFLESSQSREYLLENGIESLKFSHYFKGNSALGSLVEVCVKFVKRIIYGAVRNNVLNFPDFELLIAQTIHLINKRPIAYKETLRDETSESLPTPITPELLVKGRELNVLNIIPALHPDPESDEDPDWNPGVDPSDALRYQLTKLRKVQSNLIDSYNSEFMKTLVDQSTDKHGRYKTVRHHKLRVGDVVLLRDPMLKAHRYPLARVEEVVTNDMGEVTDVVAKRGSTGELTRRHTSSVIPFLQFKLEGVEEGPPSETRNKSAPEVGSDLQSPSLPRRPQRVAAAIGRIKTKAMFD